MGRGVPGPHHPTRGLGERRKLFQRDLGWSSGRKWILCIFEVRKKPPGTPFSVFLSDGGAPKTLRGPVKLSTGLSARPPIYDRAFVHHFTYVP